MTAKTEVDTLRSDPECALRLEKSVEEITDLLKDRDLVALAFIGIKLDTSDTPAKGEGVPIEMVRSLYWGNGSASTFHRLLSEFLHDAMHSMLKSTIEESMAAGTMTMMQVIYGLANGIITPAQAKELGYETEVISAAAYEDAKPPTFN